MSEQQNGGGYGNVGEVAQSARRAQAQVLNRATESPSSEMAQQLNADGSVAQMAGLTDGDSNSRPTIHNAQSQISYDAEEE